VVDPGDDVPVLVEEIDNSGDFLRYILLTHGHFDHVLGVKKLKEKFPSANILVGEDDLALLSNLPGQTDFAGTIIPEFTESVLGVADGATLPFGDEILKVIATPGHTKGSVCYLIDEMLFTGDTLFYHNYGRIDLPHSEPGMIKESLAKIFSLDDKIQVYPGHGKSTDIKEEKNYYL
jgi:hydroxyacylglutathione hydrolase